MKKKAILFISLLTLTLLLFSTSVLAQEGNILEDIFGPLFGGLDIPEFYNNYATVVDFILGTILFIGVAQISLGRLEQFKRRGGSAVIVVVGMMLSIGLSVWMSNNNIHLGDLGPAAGVILAVLVGYAIYSFFKEFGKDRTIAGALAYVITFYALASFGLIKALEEKYATLSAIARLVLLVALIAVISKLVSFLSGTFKKREEGGAPPSALGPTPSGAPQTRPTPGLSPEPIEPVTKLPVSRIKELVRASGIDYRLRRRLMWTDTPVSYLQKLQERKGRFESGFAYFCSQVVNGEREPFHYSLFATFVTQVYDVFEKFREELKRINPYVYKKLDEDLQIAVNETKEDGVLTEKYWELLTRIAYGVGIPPGISTDNLEKKEYKENLQKFVNDVGGANELKRRINRVLNTLRAVQDIVTNWEILRSRAFEIDKKLRKQVKAL